MIAIAPIATVGQAADTDNFGHFHQISQLAEYIGVDYSEAVSNG
jgi:hypothetical protein